MRHIKNPLHRANAQAQREFNFIAGRLRYPRTTEGASICLREALARKSNREKKEQRILEAEK